MNDDAQLLRRYAEAGSESAFSELVSQHIDLVYSAALRQVGGDAHLAQDVAQTVFADLARKARAVSRHGVLTGWLYQATRYAASKVVRTERRRATREKEAVAMQELSSEANWDDLRPLLDEAMGSLGAKDRDAVLLRYFDRKELRAVGAALGTSEAAARKRVSRALERLRRYLTARGVSLSAGTLASALTGSAVQAAPAALAGTISAAVFAGAAAAAAGSTFNLLNLMSMTKLKAGLLGAAVVVGAGTPIVVQQQSVSRLRAENRELREQSQQLEQFRSENQQLAGLRVDAEELNRLRKEVAELHRLRAEVARLRREREEPAKQSLLNSSTQTSNGKPSSNTNHLSAASGYEQYLRQIMETGTLEQQARSVSNIADAISHGFGVSPVQMDFLSVVKTRLEGGTLSTDDFATFQTALLSSATNLQDESIKQQMVEMLTDAFREVATKGLKPGSPERRETDQRAIASIRRLFSGEQLQAFDARIESVLEFKLVDWALAMGEIMKQQRATKAATGESIR